MQTKSLPKTGLHTTVLASTVCALLLAHTETLVADAIIRSQAMFADTIAEYFVEDDRVLLELEIGEKDIGTFRNLLPDELYARLGYDESPLADRLQTFATRDMGILLGDMPLRGRITRLEPAIRPLRDDVTGEALPTPEDQEVLVLRATIEYPFDGQPDALTLLAPRETGLANIGFVLYHKGVAVNDFRYLSSGFTVELDWEDAWYSRFPESGLRRQYYSPMTGFIYVEPYEVRKEIIIRPSDLQQYIDLGLDGESIIPAARHDEIKQKVVEFLSSHFPVTIDGVPVEGKVDRVNFLKRTLRNSIVIGNEDIDLLSATLGVIYVFPTEGLPQIVEMTWDLFSEKMSSVPVSSVDQAGPLTTVLEPDFNILRWENFLRFPELPTLTEVEAPPGSLQAAAGWARWGMAAISLLLLVLLLRNIGAGQGRPAGMAVSLLIASGITVILFYQYQRSVLDEVRLNELVGDLMHNVYRAFDYHGEEVIYEVLAKSVSGPLLTDIYLETQRGLELANQGGARVKVKTTEVIEADLKARDGNRLEVETRWNVSGSVGHWGHVHERTNAYHANLEITDVDGGWKLTGLEILEEQRLPSALSM